MRFWTKSSARGPTDNPPRPPRRRGEWLKEMWGAMAWRLVLTGVDDHLDADALWDTSSGTGRRVAELDSGERGLRLMRALNDHRRPVERRGARHGRWEMDWQCYADLIVEVPFEVWDRDIRESAGTRLRVLAQNLEWRYAQAFRKGAPEGRAPRCLVRPRRGLAADRVEVLFGPGVYLPDPTPNPTQDPLEAPAFRVLPSVDGEPRDLPGLRWLHDAGLQERPAAFYADQGRLLLTPEGVGPLPVAGWRSGADDFLLVTRSGENEWTCFGADAARVRSWRGPAGAWFAELAPAAGEGGGVLTLEIKPNVLAPVASAGATLMPGLPRRSRPMRWTWSVSHSRTWPRGCAVGPSGWMPAAASPIPWMSPASPAP